MLSQPSATHIVCFESLYGPADIQYMPITTNVTTWVCSENDMQYVQSYRLQIWQAYSQGQSRYDSLKIFRKGSVAMVTWPLNFRAINGNFYARQHICCSAYMLSPVGLSVRLSHQWISRKGLNTQIHTDTQTHKSENSISASFTPFTWRISRPL